MAALISALPRSSHQMNSWNLSSRTQRPTSRTQGLTCSHLQYELVCKRSVCLLSFATRRHLLDKLAKQPAHWIIPNSTTQVNAAAAECERVEAQIRERAPAGVDWQVLGIGQNGHVCFIEPADELPAQVYLTPIAEVNRVLYSADFGSLQAVPTHAITYGLFTLLSARKLCLMAVGPSKAALVARALFGPITPQFPASFIQLHADVQVFLDEAAASALPQSPSPNSRVTIHRRV
eukprot:m.379402 g.379402  ORF g.379402 m.379402 type:complete len:234 (-) comp56215_c0_seq2:1480-2181(-)